MRLLNALKSDIKFQYKQGFYFIYVVLTLFYIIVLSKLPHNLLKLAVPLVVFSDPSLLGLFFIGGIVMLEKTQGILNCIIVTPLRTKEYLFSKLISLTFIAVFASIVIVGVSLGFLVNWVLLIPTIILTSVFFTLCGFLICTNCNTLNSYFVRMIPWMLLLIIPCFSIIGFKYSYLLSIIPSVALLRLFLGTFNNIGIFEGLALIMYLCLVNYWLFIKVEKIFQDKIVFGGE